MATLDEVLGQRLADLRKEKGWSQERTADRARGWGGLRWTRLTVAQIEDGKRRLTAGELLALPLIFSLNVAEVLGGIQSDELIQISPGGAVSVDYLVRALSGDIDSLLLKAHVDTTDVRLVTSNRFSDAVRKAMTSLKRDLARAGLAKVKGQTLERIFTAADREAERAAANKFGVEPRFLAMVCFRLWGHGLTDERDKRVDDRAGTAEMAQRSRQALRGHVTRELLEELREQLDEGSG